MHEDFWGRVAKTPYAAGLRIDEPRKQEVTVQLLHTALEEIFYSIEEMPNAQLTDHLEPYIDRPMMHNLLQKNGILGEPEVIRSMSKVVTDTILGKDYLGSKVVEHVVYESPSALITAAFEQIFHDFVSGIERLLKTSFRQMNKRLNRYAVVEMVPHISHNSRIVSLELVIGEDIRHIHYRQCFPTGRYKAPVVCDDDTLRDVQSILADN